MKGFASLLKIRAMICTGQRALVAFGKEFVGDRNVNSKSSSEALLHSNNSSLEFVSLGVMLRKHSLYRHVLDYKFWQ